MQYFILYETTNTINNKTYIGIHRTANLDDGYLGSGLALKRAIKKHGKENFKRKILGFYSSVNELIEAEKLLVNEEWIKSDNNYNLQTGGDNYGILSEESKQKISKTLKNKYLSGYTSPNLGKKLPPSWNSGKKLEDCFSEERVANIKSKQSHNGTGRVPWNKGKKGAQVAWNKGLKTQPMSDEQKQAISNTLKEKYKTSIHHRKGKSPWCAGKKLPPSWNKGIKMPQQTCPHCNKLVDIGNGKRWHFDNCKHKKS